MTTRRELLLAGAAGMVTLAGCGGSSARVGGATRALQRRSVAFDLPSAVAPAADLRRLVTEHAARAGAQVTFSDDAGGGSAAQVATLRRWTGAHGGFRAIAVAALEPAAVEPVVHRAVADGIKVVAYLTPLTGASAAIGVDAARAGALLAAHASHHSRGRVVLVGPPQGVLFGDAFAHAERAIRSALGARVVGTITAAARADAATAVAALDGIGCVLTWSDLTALGAADALGPGGYAGGLATAGPTGVVSLRELQRGGPLSCLVAVRLQDLATAVVDLPLALARGGTPRDREVPVHRLTARTRARIRAFAGDYA